MKKYLVMIVALIGVLFLTACAGNGGGTTAQADGDAPATGGGSNSIVLYSNAVSDGRGEWIQERASRELGIDVQLVDLGGVALANRLIAESANPIGDVIFGLNPMLWWQMEQEGIISPHVPQWASEIPGHLNHPDGLFHAVILIGNLLIYDTAQLDPADAPGDWPELWENPAFHGRYVTPNALTGSTVQMILSGILGRHLDPNGHLGVSDEGWAHIENKFRYAALFTDQDMVVEIVSPINDAVLSQMWSHGIPFREAVHDIEIGFVRPAIGVPFSIEGAALVNGAPNEEAAIRFIEWFGTAEVMHDFSAEFGFLPAHPAALEGLTGITLQVAELEPQDLDWDIISPLMPSWIEHIYLNYLG